MNDKFSFSRFGSLLKRYVVENHKQLLFLYGVMWGVMVLAAAAIGHYESRALHGLDKICFNPFASRSALYVAVALGFSCIIASYMFSALRTKQRRIMSLMLPASMAEKYWVNFMVYILAFYPMFFIGTMLADMAYCVAAGTKSAFSLFSPSITFSTFSVVTIGIIAHQSIFALGSAIWPKLSFFKTFIAMFVFGIVAMFFPDFIAAILRPFVNHDELLGAIFALVCYVLAWLRYRHVQVIQKFL